MFLVFHKLGAVHLIAFNELSSLLTTFLMMLSRKEPSYVNVPDSGASEVSNYCLEFQVVWFVLLNNQWSFYA
jgi:hypothetical protein